MTQQKDKMLPDMSIKSRKTGNYRGLYRKSEIRKKKKGNDLICFAPAVPQVFIHNTLKYMYTLLFMITRKLLYQQL